MKQNKIHVLKTEDGTVLTKREDIVNHILQFYTSPFGTEKQVEGVERFLNVDQRCLKG